MRALAPNRALYIAAKAPRPGFAKTRLGQRLGHPAAISLYRAFLRDLGRRLAAAPERCSCTLGWYITPPDAWDDLAPLVAPDGGLIRVLAQGSGDWTARQEALFAGAAARCEERTILVASDSPHLAVETIAEAFRQLDRHDVVLGPVEDGGYYLIGMRGWHDLLRGVPMSTRTVVRDLVARAGAKGLSVGWVAPLFDVDEVTDLARLREVVAARSDLPATRDALRRLGFLPPVPLAEAPPCTIPLAAPLSDRAALDD